MTDHPDRRRDDARLVEIELNLRSLSKDVTELEQLLRKVSAEIGRVRTSLGLDFTTLTAALDKRYMPRTELPYAYVPRTEHEETRRRSRLWRWQIPVWSAAIVTAGVQVVLLLHALT